MMDTNKKPVIIIALITAVCLLGDSMLYVVLPIYWKDFGLNNLWQVGILLSINRFVRLPMNSLVGWYYNNFSKRSGIVLSVIIATVTTLSYGLVKGFAYLLLIRILWGIAWSFLRLGGYLTVLDSSNGNNRGELLGTYNGLWGIGSLVGVLAGSIFVDLYGLAPISILFAILTAISIPLSYKYVPSERYKEEIEKKEAYTLKALFKDPVIIRVLITAFLIAMIFFGVFSSTISRLIEVQFSKEIIFVGFAVGAASLAGVIQALRWGWDPFLSPFIGKLSDKKWDRSKMFTIALIVCMSFFVLIKFNLSIYTWILVIIGIQLCSTAIVILMDTLASDVAERKSKVLVMTTYTIAIDLGAATGPALVYLTNSFIPLPTFYMIMGVMLAILSGLWWFNKSMIYRTD